ncbi:MAG: response regulator [Anaerolineaceae bacterium]|nr:response regulator [Anaerolineaceae bacterium]
MSGQSILLVDDDRSIARLCQRLLERAEYEVIACTDPTDALRVLASRKMDLLISDIRMPVMDGFELISRCKQIQPSLAVLVMTGFGSVDTAIQALYRGVDGLILKPFENTTDLVRVVQRVLDESRQKQDAARAQALRPLFDVTEKLLSQTSPEALEEMLPQTMEHVFNAPFAGVIQTDGEQGAGRLVMGAGLPAVEDGTYSAWEKMAGLLSRVESASIFSTAGPGDVDMRACLEELSWSGCMASVVLRNEQQFVFFTGRQADSPPFTESDLELFGILARQAVVAMENNRLYTDLRNSITQLEESQRALIQAEKMAAVGRLSATLAHEINNPLQAVRNCLHLANRSDIGAEQRMNYLAMTTTEVDRLVSTVRHLLDFYRPGVLVKEDVNLDNVVERVLYLLRAQMESQHVQVALAFEEGLPRILGVKNQIQQVVFNLLLNAMDAMESASGEKCIWIEGAVTGKGWVVFSVEDSGTGVSAEMRDKLFEPFVSSKKQGTGLGLSVSYGIIENHGGTMQLGQPKHGQGARFEVLLPIQEQPEP